MIKTSKASLMFLMILQSCLLVATPKPPEEQLPKPSETAASQEHTSSEAAIAQAKAAQEQAQHLTQEDLQNMSMGNHDIVAKTNDFFGKQLKLQDQSNLDKAITAAKNGTSESLNRLNNLLLTIAENYKQPGQSFNPKEFFTGLKNSEQGTISAKITSALNYLKLQFSHAVNKIAPHGAAIDIKTIPTSTPQKTSQQNSEPVPPSNPESKPKPTRIDVEAQKELQRAQAELAQATNAKKAIESEYDTTSPLERYERYQNTLAAQAKIDAAQAKVVAAHKKINDQAELFRQLKAKSSNPAFQDFLDTYETYLNLTTEQKLAAFKELKNKYNALPETEQTNLNQYTDPTLFTLWNYRPAKPEALPSSSKPASQTLPNGESGFLGIIQEKPAIPSEHKKPNLRIKIPDSGISLEHQLTPQTPESVPARRDSITSITSDPKPETPTPRSPKPTKTKPVIEEKKPNNSEISAPSKPYIDPMVSSRKPEYLTILGIDPIAPLHTPTDVETYATTFIKNFKSLDTTQQQKIAKSLFSSNDIPMIRSLPDALDRVNTLDKMSLEIILRKMSSNNGFLGDSWELTDTNYPEILASVKKITECCADALGYKKPNPPKLLQTTQSEYLQRLGITPIADSHGLKDLRIYVKNFQNPFKNLDVDTQIKAAQKLLNVTNISDAQAKLQKLLDMPDTYPDPTDRKYGYFTEQKQFIEDILNRMSSPSSKSWNIKPLTPSDESYMSIIDSLKTLARFLDKQLDYRNF